MAEKTPGGASQQSQIVITDPGLKEHVVLCQARFSSSTSFANQSILEEKIYAQILVCENEDIIITIIV